MAFDIFGSKTYALVQQINTKVDAIMADLTAVQTAVANEATVVDSAVALLGSLSQQIKDLANDPAALADLANSIDAQAAELAAAVTANTPAA